MPVKTLTSGWTVIKEIVISSTPSEVFEALASPARLNKWFTSGAVVDLRPGGRYSNADGDVGTFLEISRGERLRFTWDNPDHAPNTIVEVILKGDGGKTILTLIHSQFKNRSEFHHYSSAESGWDWALENLKTHLEGGRVIGYEEWLDGLGLR